MSRKEVAELCKYAEKMLKCASEDPRICNELIGMAEDHLRSLLIKYDVECIDPDTGYILSRFGMVKLAQDDLIGAEKYFLESLANLVVRGEYCEDRAQVYWLLGMTYIKMGNLEEGKINVLRALHLYDNLAMSEKILDLLPEVQKLNLQPEDYLKKSKIGIGELPSRCSECGHADFVQVEELNGKVIYECTYCNSRYIFFLKELHIPN